MNLRLAVEKLDGIIVYPQETLSYWKTIGKPSASKGYKKGMMLKDGTIVYGIGGGLCQLSNLLFWITIHTPLQVVERHRHGYDVFPDANRTQPFGSGATCFYPYGDLMISNPTDQPFQLRLHVGKTHLHGECCILCRYAMKLLSAIMKCVGNGGAATVVIISSTV